MASALHDAAREETSMRASQLTCITIAALLGASGCGREDQPSPEYPTGQTQQPATQQQGQSGAMQGGATAQKQTKKIDPEADRLLKRMSDYMGRLPAFSFIADHTTEVVLESGQKLALAASSYVTVKRPNKMRSDRRGQLIDAAFMYDGKTVTVFGKRANKYAQAPAPDTIDETIDFARSRLDLEAPAADLIYSDPYKILTENATSGMRVGKATIDGVECHHLAYRAGDVDWQLWIEDGPRPLPRKYIITTKDVQSFPEFTVMMHDWNTAPQLSDDLFTFVPPAGAERIEFLGMLESKRKSSMR
jgi:hypothetical protein